MKIVTLTSGEQFTTKTYIIATGIRWRELGVSGEKKIWVTMLRIGHTAMVRFSKVRMWQFLHGAFLQIGLIPNSQFVKGLGDIDHMVKSSLMKSGILLRKVFLLLAM
jgi:alkyl hydroperoxide reductase subunit AhpF